ncbi:MAG: bifunctional alpha,alpha-trehalose-phosphate synthase (UDP-forming)/trehalose-phosphatase [Kiritimatiellia bacterium]
MSTSGAHLFNVSCQLPAADAAGRAKLTSTELADTLAGAASKHYRVQRIGWTGQAAPEHEQREQLARELKASRQQIPVFLDKEEMREYHDGFCHTSLWPILHYLSGYADYQQQWFQTYRQVNERFADIVAERYRPGDLVWIHDYHLMLVPQLLRERIPDARIGFFLHTPFPSYELFRCHPNRTELLRGMLGADLIGFQTFGYLRHFRSTVLRLLGIESELDQIVCDDFTTAIGVYPVGVKTDMIKQARASDEYQQYLAEYGQTFAGKKIVLSVDRLDQSQGIQKKLRAIEKYLAEHPDNCDDVMFILLVSAKGGHTRDVKQLVHDIEHAVGRINGRYSRVDSIPVHYLNRWVPFMELCALYNLADVALVTPLMDGMNVIAKEYIAMKQNADSGVLVLSEFAGVSEELFNAIRVNPYNTDEVSAAIDRAIMMPPTEQRKRLDSMIERILGYDAAYWAQSFVQALETAGREQDDKTRALDADIIKRFREKGTRKALFLDYDGSLREFVDSPEDAVPSEDLLAIFRDFDQRDDLDVYIVSGRDQVFLEKHFGAFNVTLVAEHGFFYKQPGQPWETMVGDIDLSWKETIARIFEFYSMSTPSTKVEEKHSALVWHYRQADPEFGVWKAASLIGELTETISNLPVAIHQGQKIVEVSSQHVSKGMAVTRFMNEQKYDLMLCAGDDKTDETMLYFEDKNVITVKIGDKDTDAAYRASSPQSFRRFLAAINKKENA